MLVPSRTRVMIADEARIPVDGNCVRPPAKGGGTMPKLPLSRNMDESPIFKGFC
jgi:hypothetical protein